MVENSQKSTVLSAINRYASWPFLALIALYRYGVSPLIGQRCRFYPTCSEYAETAFQRFGFIKGCLLSTKRLCKCHPWHEGGIDLVPERTTQTNQSIDQ